MHKHLLALALTLSLPAAFAADPFTDAAQKAYAPYRAALFKTNSNSLTEAQDAINKAQAAWKDVIARFGSKAPAPYDLDPSFAHSLRAIDAVYAEAATQISKGELKPAHETLEKARDILSELRHRNQVVVFSDHMNAYHSAMEVLLEEGEKTLAAPDGRLKLTEELGTLTYLATRLDSEAPANLRANAEFSKLYKALQDSVAGLRTALYHGEDAAVKAALGKLKAPYSKLFLKFG